MPSILFARLRAFSVHWTCVKVLLWGFKQLSMNFIHVGNFLLTKIFQIVVGWIIDSVSIDANKNGCATVCMIYIESKQLIVAYLRPLFSPKDSWAKNTVRQGSDVELESGWNVAPQILISLSGPVTTSIPSFPLYWQRCPKSQPGAVFHSQVLLIALQSEKKGKKKGTTLSPWSFHCCSTSKLVKFHWFEMLAYNVLQI